MTHPSTRPAWLAMTLAASLAACQGGEYSGVASNADGSASADNPRPAATDARSHFDQNVKSRLEFCRTCHVPEGVADTDMGRRFLLSENGADDYEQTHAGWQALGEGVDANEMLTMPAGTAERGHSGGEPWPEGSAAHADMRTLLQCWNDPASCGGSSDSGTGNNDQTGAQQALLGSKRGGHLWADFCAGQPDSAVLPVDPRTLVNAHQNADHNVVFNVDWQECHLNDPLRPQTCGDYRTLYRRGELIGRGQGEVGTAHMFSGNASAGMSPSDPSSFGQDNASFWTIPAAQYNTLWQYWSGYVSAGNASRPENFDALVAQRFGSVLPDEPNPYPLPGEDPNDSNGGSGQLPIALTQLRDPDGNWTGTIGVKLCSFCHDGRLQGNGIEHEIVYGGTGTIGDFTVAFRDFAAAGAGQFGLLSGLPLTIGANRGTGAIDQFQVGFLAFNSGTPEEFSNEKILFSQAIGNIKSPPWWNMGSRPQKFHGAVLPMDSSRIDMAAYYPLAGGPDNPTQWIDAVSYPFQIWAESLKAPAYPRPVNEALAKQGSILFHAKDLWAENLDNPVPAPHNRGNGSCASCHGAYAPRFVNDPAYLADPRLEGVAANITPAAIIGTDPAYADAMQSLRNADGSTPAAYDNVVFLQCGIGAAGATPDNTPVMLAPPLYGVWASAPYFHNASVPNIWGVLDPASERPDIWERLSAPAPAGMEGQVVTGFDTNIDRAYDHDKLGWKYEELGCVANAAETVPFLACNPLPIGLGDDPEASPLQPLYDFLYTELALTWNLSVDEAHLIPLTDQQIENRKVYNTNLYSQGNEGHAFTAVLTDAERRAIIEYLKTL